MDRLDISYKAFECRKNLNLDNVSPIDIVNKLKEKNKDAVFISDFYEIKDYLSSRVKENDLIITLGAGNVTKIANLLTNN